MENETPHLPQEIVANILVRLPVKSLIRFQCVCKYWKDLFKTPSFIAEHLHHSTQQNPLLVFDCYSSKCGSNNDKNNPWHLSSLNREMQVLEFQNPPIVDPLMRFWRIVHSSNGLFCLELIMADESDSFWLWNPAIRDVRQVPKSLNHYECEDFSVGFGFSLVVNDYKIVKLFIINLLVFQVEVYALTTGFWRKVKFRNLEGISLMSDSGFTYNGSIFWVGLQVGIDPGLIVSFDVAMEVFTLIPFPTKSLFLESYGITFTMYDNKLALLSSTFIGIHESSFIDLWVIEESTNESRERWIWTKIYTSRPYPRGLCPMVIWRNEIFVDSIQCLEGNLKK
ncbi:F-box/kelch-repeat protein At3g06240-like [Neltuma alba]|uniref:F-box/kelch-repeat protein At3g06240-like n=1 Tax=Neltuma alba TaxID=207710 RepID=UPI0010A45CE5|nr:F-box/kelch-repeat protein At3g06240-like [Prosopis alba]